MNMGNIYESVQAKHLSLYPEEEEFLNPFLNQFDITWGGRLHAFNTDLSVYFLKPSRIIEEAYDFSREILLVYSNYPKLEPRTFQAAESLFTQKHIIGRIENLNYFLVSEYKNADEWVHTYLSQNPESRTIVPFNADNLRNVRGDAYYVRNVMRKSLFVRDLFNYRLPIANDYNFFGRSKIVASLMDSINKNENKGIFGLRKTGKTSVLFKIKRQINLNNSGYFHYYDCKIPSIRKLRWNELLKKICEDISKEFSINIEGGFDEISIADTFAQLIEKTVGKGNIILVFDEIEYISPIAIEDIHWKRDFIHFWQTFWSVQSRYRNVCAIIVGVNPYPLEIDTIDGIQNPLFGIVSYDYLRGLEYDDMKAMIWTLGKIMGLRFDENSYQYVFERYGGHPLLTRIACSELNAKITELDEERPVKITLNRLKQFEESIDSTLMFYCRHVVSELREFYKEEYDLLEILASGQTKVFIEKSLPMDATKHLENYGLLSYDNHRMPVISIPVVGRYIGYEYMRREGRKTIYKLIDPENREIWLQGMKRSILSDLRFLETIIEKKKMPSLFGTNSFPEADEFHQVTIVSDKASYGNFLNTCNKCFVESIDNYGKSISCDDYFWNDIKTNYPALWASLYRIRLYRHAYDHLKLKEKPHEDFLKYIKQDLEGQNPSQIKELNFLIQQCVLDGFFTAIQIESNRLSS